MGKHIDSSSRKHRRTYTIEKDKRANSIYNLRRVSYYKFEILPNLVCGVNDLMLDILFKITDRRFLQSGSNPDRDRNIFQLARQKDKE